MAKIGAHVNPGPRNGYGPFVVSKPACCLLVDQDPAETEEKSGGHTVTIFRADSVYHEAPPGYTDHPDPAALARQWYPALRAKWLLNPTADFYVITNEQGGGEGPDVPDNLVRLVTFEREIMRLANLEGLKVCVLNLATGSPGNFQVWKDICAPLIVEAWAGGNIYGRHVYGDGDLVADGGDIYPGNAIRPFEELDYLRSLGVAGGIALTECGLDGGFGYPGEGRLLEQMSRYEKALRPFDEFIGLCWWSLGDAPGNPNWQSALPAVTTYSVNNPTPAWEWPDDPEEPMPTLEEKIWDASVAEQNANGVVFHPVLGLWKQIKADGLEVVTHERTLEGVTYQVGENLTRTERWVYTWQAEQPIKRFDDPRGPEQPSFEIVDVVDQLAKHPTKKYVNRPLSGVTTLTIHHTVSGGGSNPLAEVKAIAQYHVAPLPNGRDWPGIGYHFCVGANGAIYQVNRLETKSFHAGSYNAPGDENLWSVGIALLGNFTSSAPPQVQQDAARALVAYLKGTLSAVNDVRGHREMPGAQTACPGATWPQWLDYVAGEETIDLLAYLRGDGRQYRVKHPNGAEEIFQVQEGVSMFYLVKNSQYEEYAVNNGYIWRGLDTSPGPAPDYAERPGALRVYRQFEPGHPTARWCKRHMVVGETWTGPGHVVQYFYKDNCQPSGANSGNATNKVKLVARHSSKTWNGVTVNDVIELLTGTGETMFFGRDWGLVAWSADWGESAVKEVLPDSEPDRVRETGCFG